MKTIKKNKVIYSFSPDNAPIATVKLNETFWIETQDCYGGQIKTENDLRTNIDNSILDASTGPVAIKDVYAGDTICVDILKIEVDSQGVLPTAPGFGPLGELIKTADTKIVPIKDNLIHFSDDLKLPLTPMIGVLGVAPKKGEIHCATPGDHGGNIDTKEIKEENKVYFPVFVDGANLAAGDIHACMGDGELSGTGVETAGKIQLKITKVDNLKITMPIVETAKSLMVISSESSFEKATKKGLKFATDLITRYTNLSFPDAYRLLSATCDLQISQIVNPLITVRVKIPKYILNITKGI